jgi:hypothetical protein
VDLELGPALGSTQEGVAPHPREVAPILHLSSRSPSFPCADVVSLLSAQRGPLVVDPLKSNAVRDDNHTRWRWPLAGPIDSLAGRQGSLTRWKGTRLGERDRAEADRRR